MRDLPGPRGLPLLPQPRRLDSQATKVGLHYEIKRCQKKDTETNTYIVILGSSEKYQG